MQVNPEDGPPEIYVTWSDPRMTDFENMCKFTRLAFFLFWPVFTKFQGVNVMLCCNFYLSNWFHCPNALQLYHIFLICVNILWKITSWSRVSFLFLPCILIYALLDRFLSDHTIDYPVADSHPLKHAFFPSASILLEKIHTSFSLVGFTRHVHVLVCFSMTVYLFMPLLSKMWTAIHPCFSHLLSGR